MLRQTGVCLGRSAKINVSSVHHHLSHRHHRDRAAGNGKISSGPYGNRFMVYRGLNDGKKFLLHTQKVVENAEELYEQRAEIDAFAKEHITREWHEKTHNPYEPMPMAIRRFVWEAKERRRYWDKRSPFVEQLLEEHIEDKYDASFKAFPQDVRVQEVLYPESYRDPSIDELMRPKADEEIEAICKPADTYYTRSKHAVQ
ncbi:hypothetical protein DIPPA_34407 [Diplonema papillatum]|nr:hypothetical protein DIPPA_34407 [Diplonema papillatum]